MAIEDTAPFIAGDPVEVRPNASSSWVPGRVVSVERSPGAVRFGRVWRLTIEASGFQPTTVDVDYNGRCYSSHGILLVQGGSET